MAWETLNSVASAVMGQCTIDTTNPLNDFVIDSGTPNRASACSVNTDLAVLPARIVAIAADTVNSYDENFAVTPIDTSPNPPEFSQTGAGGNLYYGVGLSWVDPTLSFSYSVNGGATTDVNGIANPGLNLNTPGGIAGYPATITRGGSTFLYWFFPDDSSTDRYYLFELDTSDDSYNFLDGLDLSEIAAAFQGSNQLLNYDAGADEFYMPTVGAPGDPCRLVVIPRSAISVGGPFATVGYNIVFSEAVLNTSFGGSWILAGNDNTHFFYYFDNGDGRCFIVALAMNGETYYAYEVVGDLVPSGDEVQRINITA